jgi:hypothetical protein
MGCIESQSKCKLAVWPAVLYHNNVYRSQLLKCGITFIKSTSRWTYIEFPSEFSVEKKEKDLLEYRGMVPSGKYVVISICYHSNGRLLTFFVS